MGEIGGNQFVNIWWNFMEIMEFVKIDGNDGICKNCEIGGIGGNLWKL